MEKLLQILELVQQLPITINVVVVVLLLFSLIIMLAGLKKISNARRFSGTIQLSMGFMFLIVGLVIAGCAINFQSFDRLTHERELAQVSFIKKGDMNYEAVVRFKTNNRTKRYMLKGDQWQMDARILKWHGYANVVGLNSGYRLERLTGRYSSDIEESQNLKTVYDLTTMNEGLDIWSLARKVDKWVPWVDAIYGNSVYLPMADDSAFVVSITQSGLIARALDKKSKSVIENWWDSITNIY